MTLWLPHWLADMQVLGQVQAGASLRPWVLWIFVMLCLN